MSDSTDQHPDIERDVQSAVRAWTAQQERALTGHPDSDALLAYQEERLEEREQADLRDHVAVCESCQQDLLTLKAFDEDVADDSTVLPSPFETARSWQRFEQARARNLEPAGSVDDTPRWRHWGWLLAAGIALALGASVFLRDSWQGGSPVATLGSPVVFDLDPEGSTVLRSAENRTQVVVPPGNGPLVPTLNVGDLTIYDGYFAEVFDEGEKRLLRRDGLARDEQGRITFLVSRSEWPAGIWTVRLFGSADPSSGGAEPTMLAAYTLRLRYDP